MHKRIETVLAGALLAEIALFAAIAPHFLTVENGFEILRTSIEVGLLAVASTPILVTGGIDLSIGSMMGLAAVVFGASLNAHLGVVAATTVALTVGCAGGALNAVLIARFGIPPLIVTLGSYSMFRGIAQGVTHGATNYSGFPASFLFLGQGYLGGAIPAQLPLFLLVAAAYAVLLHRSAMGRTFYAIGFAPEGARYAGVPVARRIGMLYLLSGLVASLAAIVYVAHLGQAKSDAGTNYELDAITAVVLGGTSVFGGRGTLGGTLLGLFSLSVLQNGLRLAALPAELAGVLTGALLVITIALDGLRRSESKRGARAAVAGGIVLAGALIVMAAAHRGPSPPGGHRLTIAVMPKAKGDPYFVSCRKGAEEAARELGVDLIWDGPTGLDAAKQNEIVESWITRGVDAIAVAVENKAAMSTVLRKARARGIRVLTWDADAEPDARDYFINQATAQTIGYTMADQAARLLDGKGDFAIVTGALSAANQNEWIRYIKERLTEKYAGLKLATIQPSDDDRDKAFAQTQTILKVFPQVKVIVAISAPAVPGAAEAVQQSGRQAGEEHVQVIGLSLPSISRAYIHSGVVPLIALWNTTDLGYLTVYGGSLAARGEIHPGAQSVDAGRLGKLKIEGSDIVLGAPLIIDRTNVDRLDF